jgi:hypothetical protein
LSTVIDQAIRDGKFPEARRAHYERLYARNAKATRRLIEAMTAVPELNRLSHVAGPPLRGAQIAPITSSAGLPLRPHPMGGYYVEREQEAS